MTKPIHSRRLARRAIVPAAGLGTRLRPLTAAIPKEMLPLGRKPVLEYVVEELREAGVEDVLFVVSPGKGMIHDYFGDGAQRGVRCEYATQPEMRGLGDAVLHGAVWAAGETFVVAFGDCIIRAGDESPLRRMMELHASHDGCLATVLTEQVAAERTGRYGILAPAASLPETPAEPFPITDLVEKPAPADAPSRQAVAARWVLDPAVFDYLRAALPGANGEVNLTDPVRAMLADARRYAPDAGTPHAWAVPLRIGEARLDIGGWDTYLSAAARAALDDPEAGAEVRATLRDVVCDPCNEAHST